jgi:hypothetical protein
MFSNFHSNKSYLPYTIQTRFCLRFNMRKKIHRIQVCMYFYVHLKYLNDLNYGTPRDVNTVSCDFVFPPSKFNYTQTIVWFVSTKLTYLFLAVVV